MAGLKNQCSKNAAMMRSSAPVPHGKLPRDVKTLQSVTACQTKEKGKNLHKFETRHCVNGSSMVQGQEFDFSSSPTVSCTGLRIFTCAAAARGLHLSGIDVQNCFQNDAIPPEKRICVSLPPCHMEWFNKNFPHIKLEHDSNNQFVSQTVNGMQGRRDAGTNWHILLKFTLEEIDTFPCHFDHALFVKCEGSDICMLVTSTDNFLCGHSHPDLFFQLTEHIKLFVPTTTQDDKILKHLNARVIQSDLAMSIDQTCHIQSTILDKWHPPSKTECLKTADTPYRTDSACKRELEIQLPANENQSAILEKHCGGKNNALLGQILHVMNVTRLELGLSMAGLSQFNVSPNEASFQGLACTARFLATHNHSPIFCPCRHLNIHQTIRFEHEPGKFLEHMISNVLSMFKDSDHARCAKSRRSIPCILATLNGVTVDWHMGPQSCTAAHSTDAEIQAQFTAAMRNRHLHPIMEWLHMPLAGPTGIWEDNQPAIDIVSAGHITGRVQGE